MSDKKVPCFYTKMINKLNSLDNKVDDIQNSIKMFRAMIDERMRLPPEQLHEVASKQAIQSEDSNNEEEQQEQKVGYE